MQRLSVSQFSSFRWSFFQDILKYAKLGYQSVGIWRQKVDEFGLEAAADLLFEMQMNVSSYSWAGGFTGSEGNSFKLAVDDAIEAVYQAHLLGARKLIIHPGSRNGHTHTHGLRLIKSGLNEIIPVAQDLGVQLLLEPVTTKRNPWSFVNDSHTYQELMDHFCDSQVGLVMDLFHIGESAEFMFDLPKFAERIKLVQVADGVSRDGERVRCPLGKGSVPIKKWLTRLSAYGFNGDFEIELHGAEFENADYEKVLYNSQKFLIQAASGILSSTSSN